MIGSVFLGFSGAMLGFYKTWVKKDASAGAASASPYELTRLD